MDNRVFYRPIINNILKKVKKIVDGYYYSVILYSS